MNICTNYVFFTGTENRSPVTDQKVKRKKKHKLNGICTVCGDKASANKHYGSKVCFSCRAFFRRLATKGKMPEINSCNRLSAQVGKCQIEVKSRHLCAYCRYLKCRQNGMEPKLVMSRDEIEEMREKAKEVKLTGICSGKLPKTEYELRVQRYLNKDLNDNNETENLEKEKEKVETEIIELSDFDDFVINDFVPNSIIASEIINPVVLTPPPEVDQPSDETILMEFIQSDQTDLILKWPIDEDWTFAQL